jgi:hypothetical protein
MINVMGDVNVSCLLEGKQRTIVTVADASLTPPVTASP